MAARTLRTPICDLFGIDVPIILAGMGGVSMAPLVAAVSNAGGLGVIGAANLSPDELRAQIRETKALTRKPFGRHPPSIPARGVRLAIARTRRRS